ncbi:MAG: hypothetical protein ACOC8K_03965, partial [Gemmatimonadota bacterium]
GLETESVEGAIPRRFSYHAAAYAVGVVIARAMHARPDPILDFMSFLFALGMLGMAAVGGRVVILRLLLTIHRVLGLEDDQEEQP